MKLLYCEHCHDIFALSDKLRTCECGQVKGRYINDYEAEVSPGAICIAIDGYSLGQAIEDMWRHQAETANTAAKEEYYEIGNGGIACAWVRPNSGPGNPRTRLIETETSEGLDKRYLRMALPDKHKITTRLKEAR